MGEARDGWAYELYGREPTRLMVFVTAGQIERADFGTETGWLLLAGLQAYRGPGSQPYPPA